MIDSTENVLLRTRNDRDVSFFDLCSVDDMTDEDIWLIFELARVFRDAKTEKLNLCRWQSMINAFFENSTRTMSSFDLSGKHLSMDTNNVGSTSSVKKWESYVDTAETLDAYNVSVIIVRSRESWIPSHLARHVQAAIVNAWDGWHEHPTQWLLDLLTIVDYFGTTDLSWKIVTIVGDIMHSRVFGSLVRLLVRFGATVRIAAPITLIPDHVERFWVAHYTSSEEAITGADVVYALRVQEERWAKWYIPTLREYSKTFGINERRFNLAKKDAILMHPGPVIRDIDIMSPLVARHSQSYILKQVENGMAVRKAILWLLSKRFDGQIKSFTRF